MNSSHTRPSSSRLKQITRTPPRLPWPGRLHRALRQPPEPGITSPVLGFAASQAQNAPRSSSVQYFGHSPEKVGVSAMVNIIEMIADVARDGAQSEAYAPPGRRNSTTFAPVRSASR